MYLDIPIIYCIRPADLSKDWPHRDLSYWVEALWLIFGCRLKALSCGDEVRLHRGKTNEHCEHFNVDDSNKVQCTQQDRFCGPLLCQQEVEREVQSKENLDDHDNDHLGEARECMFKYLLPRYVSKALFRVDVVVEVFVLVAHSRPGRPNEKEVVEHAIELYVVAFILQEFI